MNGGKYSLYWNSDDLPTVESQKVGIDNTNLFETSMYNVTDSSHSNDTRAKCVSTLLNTNNWTKFVNQTYADKAIGGPTVEMWKESWNAKGNIKGTDQYPTMSISIVQDGYSFTRTYFGYWRSFECK